MRTVELHLPDEFLAELAAHGVGPIDKRLCDAIGYLSMWGLNGRAKAVRIVGDRRGELTAVYTDSMGGHVFTIGAVPDDSWTYTFHS